MAWIPLPYAEDIRRFKFPSLDAKEVGDVSQAEADLIDQLIDERDLSDEEKLYALKMLDVYCSELYEMKLRHREDSVRIASGELTANFLLFQEERRRIHVQSERNEQPYHATTVLVPYATRP